MGGGLTSCHPPWRRPANHIHSCNKRQHVTGRTAWNMYDILPVSVNTGRLVKLRTKRWWETITNVPESPRKLKHLIECVAMRFSVHFSSFSPTTAVILDFKRGLKGFYRSYLDRIITSARTDKHRASHYSAFKYRKSFSTVHMFLLIVKPLEVHQSWRQNWETQSKTIFHDAPSQN